MKFVIPTQELNFLINKIQNVVPVKPALPILSHVLVEVADGVLTLTATDLTVGIRCETEVKVIEGKGVTTWPARKIAQLLRELTAPTLEIAIGDAAMTEITAGSSKFKIQGMKSGEFPKLPDITPIVKFRLSHAVLKDLFYRVSFAISRDDSRYVLTGALMRIANGEVVLLGTDGKRLARAHAQVQVEPSFIGSYIIPLKTIDELLKSLVEDGEATVYLMSDKMGVEIGSTTIISKLLAGEYPDVSRVIPDKSEAIVTLHREELMTLLRQVSLFTADNNHSVKFTFSNGNLHLSANTSEIGEGNVNMPINYQGDKIGIAFNPGFFIDILRHIKEETATIGITDAYNPGVITEKEEALTHASMATPLFVLMPMRLSEG